MTNQTYTFFLDGIMVAEEPLTVTHKDAQSGKEHKLPRAGKHEDARPYWPASNIRGALRHAIAQVVAMSADQSGHKLGLSDHFMISQGTDIDGVVGDKEGKIDQHKVLRSTNPALSLLGRWKLSSRMDIGNAYPTSRDCVAYYGQGARRIMFEVQPEMTDMLTDDDKARLGNLLEWQAEASGNKADLKSQIRELTAKLKAAESAAEKRLLKDQIEGLKEQEKTLNKGDSEEGATGIRRPLPGYEAFNAGTEFTQRIALHNVTLVEAGLFIAGLAKFARYPQLGAKASLNNGKVSFEWDVRRYEDEDSLAPVKTGSVKVSVSNGVSIEDELLQKAHKEWKEVSRNPEQYGVDFKRLA